MSEYDGIYDILVDYCGAREDDREAFRINMADGCREYRFMGALGFGGKLYVERSGYRVGYYPEDQTPENDMVVQMANDLLRLFPLHRKDA